MTQRSASTRLDLPQPLGPTMPVMPGSITSSVWSTNDLKPEIRSFTNCTARPTPIQSYYTKTPGSGQEPSLSITLANSVIGWAPTIFSMVSPRMITKVGVDWT